MLTTVETKLSSEKSLLAELQARIEASQQRINKLNEYNAVADGLLQAAQDAKGKISDQEVIADLLAHLSHLLGGGDNNTDDGGNGNHPKPEPQPGDNGGCEMTPQPNDDSGSEVVVELKQDSSDAGHSAIRIENIPHSSVDAIAVQPEPLIEQHCTWASPWASPLASPLCCQMEDAPESVLVGQAVDLAEIAFSRDGFKYIDYGRCIIEVWNWVNSNAMSTLWV